MPKVVRSGISLEANPRSAKSSSVINFINQIYQSGASLHKNDARFPSNNTNYQLWQQNNHPIELNTSKKREQRLNYIHQNPVEAGFVLSPEDYLYNSAMNYTGRSEVLLDVMLM